MNLLDSLVMSNMKVLLKNWFGLVWFGLVYAFNGISTFNSYLINVKAILKEEQLWYEPSSQGLKLVYFGAKIQNFSYYTLRTSLYLRESK